MLPIGGIDDGYSGKNEEKFVREEEVSRLSVLFKNKINFRNLIVLMISWSASSFTFYFVEFYMKLVPVENEYLLMGIIGLADLFSLMTFYFMAKAYKYSEIRNIHSRL